ncbi:MAG: TetR/AcrR family transcriptional regulator [Flammeovirgaceae bacterium]
MKRAQHAAETRTKILKVTRELLQEHGYQKTTTRMIIQCCGIRNSTLYHFFQNKEDILLHIALTIIEKVRELIERDYNHSPEMALFHELCWYYFSLLENTRHAELYLVAFRSYRVSKVIHSNMMDRVKQLGKVETEEELEIIISMILGFLQAIGDQYIHGQAFDQQQMIRSHFKLLLKTLDYDKAERQAILAKIAYKEIEAVVPNYPILRAL